MKLLFLLRDLDYGGAQRQLIALAGGLQRRGHAVTLVAFYAGGAFEGTARNANVKVCALDKKTRWDLFSFVHRLVNLLRRERPDIIYSCLDGPNVISGVLRGVCPSARLVWGVRSSYVDWRHYSRFGYLTYRVAAWLSFRPNAIIFNSNAGRDYHSTNGFCDQNAIVIENGIDTDRYSPNTDNVDAIRESWGARSEDILIGSVGRFDGMKDLPTFFRAAKLLSESHHNVRFICVGSDSKDYGRDLMALGDRLGVANRIKFIDYTDDTCGVYNALDILVSSSIGEGFSNVIGEAMACGTPCVVTDVGDSEKIVGDTGYAVPPGNPAALARGLERMLARLRKEAPMLSKMTRERILQNYSLDIMLNRNENVFVHLMHHAGLQHFGFADGK